MVYSFFGAFIASFFLGIIRDKDAFFNYSARIEALSVTFLVSTFSSARTVDRFSAVFSAFIKSLL
jgi:hypothetical protein